VKKVIGFLLCPLCAVLLLSLIVTPQTKIYHRDSSAFQLALQQAVDRLEGGSRLLLAGTVTPVAAHPMQPTFDGRYTCETYEQGFPTCDPGAGCLAHTADPQGHTCMNGEYTCQLATCDTYDSQMPTCDPNGANCNVPHTTEPAPYNHTCEGHTCDGSFTCDFTVDPRAVTCDAADPQCLDFTFDAFMTTCDPMRPECRTNNPKGHCTAQNYPTCVAGVVTCDVADPLCVTINPAKPECATPVKETTWGQIKAKYSEQK
jgi:hypothetical protein